VQVADDSTYTFVRALKDTITEDVCMVLVVLSSNRKERYDAIKTVCCIECPGNDTRSVLTIFVQLLK
jgi:hypothetical protein